MFRELEQTEPEIHPVPNVSSAMSGGKEGETEGIGGDEVRDFLNLTAQWDRWRGYGGSRPRLSRPINDA